MNPDQKTLDCVTSQGGPSYLQVDENERILRESQSRYALSDRTSGEETMEFTNQPSTVWYAKLYDP